jgi:hypothetical protein
MKTNRELSIQMVGLCGLVLFLSSVPGLAQAPGTFAPRGNMTTGRMAHTATLLKDGRVLVVGGYSGSAFLATAELYDLTNENFSPTGSMSQAFENLRATLLLDGRVLITGHNGHAELYDPITGRFSVTGDMIASRQHHTATLLLNGKVLITGASSTAELYDPATGTFTPTGSTADTSMAAANLLPGGRVLRIGVGSAEIYDPVYRTAQFSLPEGSRGVEWTIIFWISRRSL